MKIYSLTEQGKALKPGQLDPTPRTIIRCIGDESRVISQIIDSLERTGSDNLRDAFELAVTIRQLETEGLIRSIEVSL